MLTRFRLRSAAPDKVALIQREMNLPRFIAHTLVARGVDTPEAVERFVHPSLERDWLNPYDLPNMQTIVETLSAAIDERKHVIVFGDFDLDGISATTVLTRGLRALGGRATPFIPKRFDEGYGLTMAAFDRLKVLDPDLIITVDCGISCRDEVRAITEAGVPVIITDHHEAADCVPLDVPVCDPKADPGNPSAILAGVGVALKLVQALGSFRGYPHLWRSYTDFATLGTIADLMPMKGENRALVSDGLARMNKQPRPCIAALIAACGAADKPLTSTNLSFSLVPRLNAAGRMGDAQLALDLLMSDSFDEASTLALQLEEVNTQRRIKEAELSEIAKEQAKDVYDGGRALVVAGSGWHEGVKGIVASRLVGIYGVPTLLFTIEGDEARGSGRSVGNVNLFAAVEGLQDLLIRFGGHGAAVGVTLPVANLEEFTRRLCDHMDSLPESEFHPMVEVDASVRLSELTLETVGMIDLLAPFGQENPEPKLLARNVVLDRARAVGADKNHFSCYITDGCASISAILFHCANIEMLLTNETVVDAAFTAQIDEWRGRRNVKAMLETLAPACSCAALEACVDPSMSELFTRLFSEDAVDAASSEEPSEADAQTDTSAPTERQQVRSRWEHMARTDPHALEAHLVRAIIGDGTPHDAQRKILDRLDAGRSTLGVMATGRGKSLIFQVHAAMLALAKGMASLFVYPLRALMADQAFHLSVQFERFGMTTAVLNGETTKSEREVIYQGLADGSIDIVLTTPEYLSFHADRIAECARIGFMVVDEAHHIGQAKAGQRMPYRQLGEVARRLGEPVILAVTATAPDEVAKEIWGTLPLEGSVVDETSRENLHLDDQRNIRNKDDYLAHIVASGGKCVVYVNSREQSIGVARRLRRRVPQLGSMIGFYNAGLTRDERNYIEDLFRQGDIQVLVATSAFGEGIDIPDIRHVVLYHMPFNDVEFNQMSGRAGRDGADAWVHLLYGRQDASINEALLRDMAPDRDTMAQVYRRMRQLQANCPSEDFQIRADELAKTVSEGAHHVSEQAAECGVCVFRELGLIEEQRTFAGNVEVHTIRVREDAAKVELTDSVRYQEGLDELSSFYEFREWAMHCDLGGLVVRVQHPIIPLTRHP